MKIPNLTNFLDFLSVLEHHALVRRRAAGCQALRQAARMGFQPVTVRVEEVQRIAGAAVLLPFRHASRAQAGGKGRIVVLGNGKALSPLSRGISRNLALPRLSDCLYQTNRSLPCSMPNGSVLSRNLPS